MKKTLGEIFEIGSGGTPSKTHPEYYGGDIPWVKTGDLKDEYLYSVEDCITEEGLKNSSAKMYQPGTVLIAMYGATIGATSILKLDACTNQACAAFKPCKDVMPEYLYYFLRSKKQKFISDGVGGAQPNISAGYLKKVNIDIRTIEEQEKIVTVLGKLNGVIQKRQREIDELDNIIKARFIEMFGDPMVNPKGWDKEVISEHIDLLSGFPFKSEQYVDEGINICGGLIIMPQRIEWDNCVHWPSVDGYEDFLLNEGDIVMALDRPWITEGFKVARVDGGHLPALLIQRTARIRATDINQDYLYYCFIGGGFDKHSNVTGSLVPHISAKDIRSFEIMLPPIELQNEFADFLEQVDKSKFAIQKALAKTQTLFDSLMQEYFG